ncbi:MAG: hypothetical protein ACRBB6_01770 [Neptuniibacter sp.]
MDNLIQETSDFFNRHWHGDLPVPTWNFDWAWKGPVPNYLLGGLYALFRDESLIYIGLGRSGVARGISARLESHVLAISGEGESYGYVPQEKWQKLGVNRLATIGFPPELSYLSPALEDYLIDRLQPIANSVGKANVK